MEELVFRTAGGEVPTEYGCQRHVKPQQSTFQKQSGIIEI